MLRDVLHETRQTMRAHVFRVALTSLGIVWGVAMLVYLTASSDGYDRHFAVELAKIGQRIVFLFPGNVTKQRVGHRGARPVELELKDVRRLGTLAGIERAAPNQWIGARVLRAGRRTKLAWTYGVTEDTGPIRNFALGAGRGITRHDVDTGAAVAFLGAKAASRLFGGAPAVGRTMHIDGIPFRVVGVSAPKGQQVLYMGPADDEIVLIPITTARHWFTRVDVIDQVVLSPTTREGSRQATRDAKGLLGLHHGFRENDPTAVGDFNILEAVQVVEVLLLGLRVFLTAASLVTLFVGAVGVMNIMLVLVSERTREIGLRKAVGASNRAIFVQILVETVTLTLVSGVVGALLGALGVQASAAAIGTGSTLQAPPELRPVAVASVLATLVLTGLAAGILPALRAMRTDPAVALRAS